MRAGRGRPFNRVRTGPGVGELADHTHVTRNSQKRIPNFVQLYHHTRNCTLARALTSDHDAPRGAQRDGHNHLSFIYALPQERRFTDDDARPTASPRARTHVAPTHPASDAVSGRPLLWTRHTGTRRGGGAPSAAVPTAAVLTAAVPTAATAALSRCVPCSWYPKWYPSTWRQTAPRSQTPCTHRPHSRPERRRSSLST